MESPASKSTTSCHENLGLKSRDLKVIGTINRNKVISKLVSDQTESRAKISKSQCLEVTNRRKSRDIVMLSDLNQLKEKSTI